jgi:hypothetical protein
MKKPSDNSTAAMIKWLLRGRGIEIFLAATSTYPAVCAIDQLLGKFRRISTR